MTFLSKPRQDTALVPLPVPQRTEGRILAVLVFFMILLVPLFSMPHHRGLLPGDAAYYLKYAHQLLNGSLVDSLRETVFAHRIGTYAPYALGMAIGKPGPWLNWITVLEFIFLLILVYRCLMRWNAYVAAVATLLLVVSPLLYHWSAVTMGDMAATLTANLPLLLYFRYHSGDKRHPVWHGGMLGLFVLIAALTKESIAFMVPILMYLAYLDWRSRADMGVWKAAMVVLGIGGLAVVLWYAVMTGDPFLRFRSVEWGPSSSDCNYATASWGELFARLTYQPFQLLVTYFDFGLIFLLSLLSLMRKGVSRTERLLRAYFIGTLGLWWLGSQSLSTWNPVALVDRLWLPLMVPMALNAAVWVVAAATTAFSERERWGMTIVLGVFFGAATWALVDAHAQYTALGLYQTFVWVGLKYAIVGGVILLFLHVRPEWVPTLVPPPSSWIFSVVWGIQLVAVMLGVAWHVLAPSRPATRYDIERTGLALVAGIHAPILTNDAMASGYGIYNGFTDTIPFVDWAKVPEPAPCSYLYISKQDLAWRERYVTETLIYTRAGHRIPPYVTSPEVYGFCVVAETPDHALYYLPCEGEPLAESPFP